jgi:thiol-disulfide isomerase/thioredoxin
MTAAAMSAAGSVWAAPEKIVTLAIGAEAPPFALPGVDGKIHKLSDYDDAKVLVVIFTCNHCPTAQAYEKRIKKLVTDFKDKGVAFVAISPNDPRAVRLDELGYTDVSDSLRDMQIRAKDKQFNFPYLYDGDEQEVSKAYGPMTTPHVFVFDGDRKLRFAGRIDNNERNPEKVTSRDTRDAIEALLAGRPVPVEKTKTMGCSIKWSYKRDSVQEAFEKWAQEPVTLEPLDLAGVRELMENDSDKLRVINVWSTRCGPCVIEFPEFVEINRMYRRRDFEMVSLNVEGLAWRDRVHAFLKDKEASFTNYIFSGDDVYAFIEALDPQWPGAIPYTLVLKPGGEVLYRHMGMIDALELKQTVVEHLGRTYQ